MAKVMYKEGFEPLSGVYCGVSYKVYGNGTCTAHVLPLPSEKEIKKNPAARAEYVIKTCVSEIQRQMNNKREAMEQYKNITHRVQRIYASLYELEEDNDELQKMILTAYYQSRRVLPSRKVAQPGLFGLGG
jgi:hypothetical protein